MTDQFPKTAPSYPVSIFIAGDPDAAREVCRDFCDDVGFCVTVTPTTYVYTGGQEAGVIVGLINYPRFPRSPAEIQSRALALALKLKDELGQESFSIQYPDTTIWHSWREVDSA